MNDIKAYLYSVKQEDCAADKWDYGLLKEFFNKNNIKNHFKVFLYKNYTTLIIFFSIGFFINYSYVYFIKNIENLFIFYSPTIDRRLSNIYILSIFYGITSILVFIFFYKLFYKNKFILNDYDFTCICLWPTGAEQKS